MGSLSARSGLSWALPAREPLGELSDSGFTIIENLLPTAKIAALYSDLSGRFANTPFCDGEFYGRSTKRFGSLLTRSKHSDSLVRHPLILDLVQSVLGPHCDRYQLNLTQAVEIHPGAPAQPQHRDQDMWGGPKGSLEYLLNVIWPLTDFTEENGATVVWPGSHRCQNDYMLPRRDAIAAEMKPGSALVFLGSALHGGGANRSKLPRAGVIISYSLGWLKPFESQFLLYPPAIAKEFPTELAALVGYAIHRPNLGNYEGQCPSVLLKGAPSEFMPAKDALRPEHESFIRELRASRESS
jgi:ectoine hydroxylase-related dioxygenase (phytanoyl-CoA dioxygenase family)